MAYQPFDLTGKVALVTGGNGGLGLGMAEAVAMAGADVVIWGTNPDKNEAALERLAKTGRKVEAMICDVADRAAIEEAFAKTLESFGRVDACFANAGVSGWKSSVFDIDDEEWRRVIGINLDGAFHTMRTAARHMIDRAEAGDPGGRIIATASTAAVSGAARNEHYAASKGGVVSMVRAMAVEFARHGITVNALLPGWAESDMTARSFAWDKFRDSVLPRIPMRRWGTPEDFGGIAVYLSSDASAYHTGGSLIIDGGYLLY